MREVDKFIDGLTQQQANDSIPVASMGGDIGGGPIDSIFFGGFCAGLEPDKGDSYSNCQLFPTNKTDFGTESDGSMGTSVVVVPFGDGDPSHFGGVGPLNFHWTKAGGGGNCSPWESSLRLATATGPYPFPGATCSFFFNVDVLEPIDFTIGLTDTPHDLTAEDPTWDGEQGTTELTFQYDNADNEDPEGLTITRSKDGGAEDFVATVMWHDGQTEYTFTDYVFETGTYTYKIQSYKIAPNVLSPFSTPVIISFDGGTLPDISVTGDLILDISMTSVMTFISDPSGIYTLVPDKTHDTLYERLPAVTTIEIKIPDPFGKTGFVP